MNHNEEINRFALAYADLALSLIIDIQSIKNTKHRIEKKQELEKINHYLRKVGLIIDDLNEWLTAFGVDGNAAENP